jgi:dihydropteroate synthase
VKDTFFSSKLAFNCKGILMEFDQPIVMGILNITPDSFYVQSRQKSLEDALATAKKMISDGAKILDIGGYSSRPGASDPSVAEEISRITSIIQLIRKNFPTILISCDTFRSEVAEVALKNGAHIINDISGGRIDPKIYDVVAKYNCPYILMHMRGTPQTMLAKANYKQLVQEVLTETRETIYLAQEAGVKDIIVDPGFGFSKNSDQNFMLLKELNLFKTLDKPLLVGLSRKSMIYKTLGITAQDSLNGTSVLNTIALLNGAQILRVHDVKEAVEAIKLVRTYQSAG